MAATKRRCATCRYFQDSGMSGNGWCTHPDRQVSSDVRILVRKAELACRNAWGSDLWEDASSPEKPAAARTEKPRPDSTPQPTSPMTVSYDDEVTSVVNADQHQASRPAQDDEVVDQSIINFSDDYMDEEQDERRNLLYRDSRNAIEQARQRHLQRRQQPIMPAEDESSASENDDIVISEGEESVESIAASLQEPIFEPDDFVEEEAPSSDHAIDENDDALLSEGIRTLSPRAARLRRFREERNAPKEPTVTKTEPEPDDVELVLPPSAAPERGRFDSIPEISADIELPLLRRSSSASREERPEPETSDSAELPNSYERALKRAHALNAAARAEENAERRRSTPTPPVTGASRSEPPQQRVTMPDLPEDTMPDIPEPTPVMHAHTGQPRRQEEPARAIPNRTAPRPRQDRQARPAQDPRRSWWRGHRARLEEEAFETDADAEPQYMAVPEIDDSEIDVAADLSQAPSDPDSRGEIVSTPVSFDLAHEEGMESFRDRLFSSSPAKEEPASVPQRSPIRVTRRNNRPITPAARERYRAEREPFRQERPAPAVERYVPSEDREPARQVRPASAPERQPARPMRREPVRQHDEYPRNDARTARPERVERPRPMAQLRAQAPAQPRQQHIEPEELLDDPEDAWYEPEPTPGFDVRAFAQTENGLLDMTIEIAPEVSRSCQTCRNYRPSEQPGRGWCTNSWAFTHRQMVNETDLACDSTIGCWWLPADEEVWLSDFEVASEATPRVDRLVAHLNPERRAVGN